MTAERRPAREFTWPVRVYWEDTDAGGIVYHASFLRFMERARTEWLRAAGFEQQGLRAEDGVMLVVARMSISFSAPGRYDDQLRVGVRMARPGRASLDLEQWVRRFDGADLCRAEVRVACVDAVSLRPRALPYRVRSEFARDP